MAIMIHRTTLALDEATIQRMRKLSEIWGVSRSEAVRRALEMTERRVQAEKRGPQDRLAAYHRGKGLDRSAADKYLREVSEGRIAWRGEA